MYANAIGPDYLGLKSTPRFHATKANLPKSWLGWLVCAVVMTVVTAEPTG
jgi:hypothetical protein